MSWELRKSSTNKISILKGNHRSVDQLFLEFKKKSKLISKRSILISVNKIEKKKASQALISKAKRTPFYCPFFLSIPPKKHKKISCPNWAKKSVNLDFFILFLLYSVVYVTTDRRPCQPWFLSLFSQGQPTMHSLPLFLLPYIVAFSFSFYFSCIVIVCTVWPSDGLSQEFPF